MEDIEKTYLKRLYEKADKIPDHFIMGFEFEGRTSEETNNIVQNLEKKGFISKVLRFGRNKIRCYVTEKTFDLFEKK